MDNDIKTILAKRLKMLLEDYDMTQFELSKRSNVTEATISNFLNCKQLPKLEVVSKIADVLNVSVDYLLGRTNIQTTIEKRLKDNNIKAYTYSDINLEKYAELDENKRKFIEKQMNAMIDAFLEEDKE